MRNTFNRRCADRTTVTARQTFARRHACGLSLLLTLWLGEPMGVSAAAEEGKTHIVVIESMAFSPASVRVNPGDRVTFHNRDLVPHTATSQGTKVFDSGIIQPGESWTLSPPPGQSIRYVCTFHPTMKGEIVVAEQ